MRKILFCLFILILSFQFINATETNITVKTVPFKNINIVVLSSSLEVYDRFNKDADKYGDASFVFSSDKYRFDLNIFIKDLELDKKVAYKSLENQVAGENIYVEVIPEDFTIVETPGEENETQVQELLETDMELDENLSLNDSLVFLQEESEKKPGISGWAISFFGEDSKLRNILLYAFGGILLFSAGFFTVKKVRNRKKGEKKIKIKKLSELVEEKKIDGQKDTPQNYYGILNDTQKRLEQTQKELSKFKNQEKIKEIERKIQRDQQELKKLKEF
jgi:hypothetical protein